MPQSAAKLAAKKAAKKGKSSTQSRQGENPHTFRPEVVDDFDFVDEDPDIPDQMYTVISFYEPEQDTHTLREVYFMQEFIKECLREDPELDKRRVDFKKVSANKLVRLYTDFRFDNVEELNKKAKKKYPDQIFERAVKVRGSYKSVQKAHRRRDELRKHDQIHNQYVMSVGKWAPFNPPAHAIEEYETSNKRLNDMMHAHRKNIREAKEYYEQEKQERIRQCVEINEKRRKNIENNDEETLLAEEMEQMALGLLSSSSKPKRAPREKPSKANSIEQNVLPEQFDINMSDKVEQVNYKKNYKGIRVNKTEFEHKNPDALKNESGIAEEYENAGMSADVNTLKRRKAGKDKIGRINFDDPDFDEELATSVIRDVQRSKK